MIQNMEKMDVFLVCFDSMFWFLQWNEEISKISLWKNLRLCQQKKLVDVEPVVSWTSDKKKRLNDVYHAPSLFCFF